MATFYSKTIFIFIVTQLVAVRFSSAAAVSTSSPEATQAAIAVLKSGGNAVDAACAAVFALNVTQPHFSGIGGGGFALIHQKDKGDSFLDFRESAPEGITPQLFLNSTGHVIPSWSERNTGGRAVGVPGVVAGCGLAVKESGKLPWRKVLEPAIHLARNGFVISQLFQEELSDQWQRVSPFEFTKALLQGKSENGLKKGETLKQPILAQTLERLAQEGPESFYSGELAKKWLKEAQGFGVKITSNDLENYHVYKRDLISFNFGKFHGVTVSAPSSAGLTVAAVLRYLNHYYSTHSISKASSLKRYLIAIEAKSFFGKMRNESMSDPSRMSVSTSDLLSTHSESKAWRKLDKIIQFKLSKLAQQKRSKTKNQPTESLNRLETHTAHVSVVDDLGNAVALTSSVGNIFGSGIILPKTGFVLNSTLGDFNPAENQLNSPAPRARPLSNMSPLLLFEGQPSNQRLVGVLGAAGGSLIPSGIVDFVQNYYVHDMSKDEAIQFPRIHSEDGVGVVIERHASPQVMNQLEQIGYRVEPIENIWSVFEGVVRKSSQQKWEAVAESRYDGLGLTLE
jgi:gamma-glutamyltranspeptidase/glutathione hydrolase